MSEVDPTKPDLSLVETDHLIEALKERHEAMLLVRIRRMTDKRDRINFEQKGGAVFAVGLAEFAKHQLINSPEPMPIKDDENLDNTAG